MIDNESHFKFLYFTNIFLKNCVKRFGCNLVYYKNFLKKLAFVKDSFSIFTFIYKSDKGERAKYDGYKC